MDLNKLSTFVRVVEEGNFTRAAVALGLRKSSVSRSVAQLEHDLDVRLLHRTTRKLKLTDAGRAYFESVREAIAKVMDATATLREAGQEPSGTIRLTAPPGAIESILVDMVTRFVRRYPKIRIELSLTSVPPSCFSRRVHHFRCAKTSRNGPAMFVSYSSRLISSSFEQDNPTR